MLDFAWITDQMFEDKLEDLVDMLAPAEILGISGVREIVREELYNDVLEALISDLEECEGCGKTIPPGQKPDMEGLCTICAAEGTAP